MFLSESFLEYAEGLAGWIYFTAWTISFYPQMHLNYTRKTVTGLNFDYIAINILGFSAYAIYTSLFFWMPAVRNAFQEQNAGETPQVELNDVIFALHGTVCCVITGVQCIYYPRGNQTVRRPVAVTCILFGFAVALGFGAAWFGLLDWLRYMRFCGLIKFLASFTKYLPQVLFNYWRKSTRGFSFEGIAFDFTGGVFSVAQQTFRALRQESLSPFTKNFAKTGLGFETLLFDVIFIIQHVFLYGAGTPVEDEYARIPEKELLTSDDRSAV